MDNNTKFYSIDDNSLLVSGFPWIDELNEGFGLVSYCKRENRSLYYGKGEMVAKLDKNKGTKWPDILGCGAYPFLILSERVINCWKEEGIGTFPLNKIKITLPLPKKLSEGKPPHYYWIDGAKLHGAKINFEASGYVSVKYCPECGTRSDDIAKTFQNQHAKDKKFSYVFHDKTWNGLNLFTTDISDTMYFCTEKVLDSVKVNKFTNFRFIPIEEGNG